MDLQLVIEISAVATLVSSVVSYFTFRKSSSLNYVTKERKEWRDALRSIAEDMEQCPFEKRKAVLVRLKTRINAYGLADENVMEDTHIWDIIKKIEVCDEADYDNLKQRLIYYLSALLKYDWERSKKEVYGEPLTIIVYILNFIALGFLAIGLMQVLGKNITEVLPDISVILLIIIGVALLLSTAKKDVIKQGGRKEIANAAYPFVLLLGVIFLLGQQKNKLTENAYFEAACVAGVFAGGLRFVITLNQYFAKDNYQCTINKIDKLEGKKKGAMKEHKVEKRWRLLRGKNLLTTIVCLIPIILVAIFLPQNFYRKADKKADLISIYLSAFSLSATVLIAFLIYWLQKSDNDKEQQHRQQTAVKSMRYAIENGIRWILGSDDAGLLGAAASIKDTMNLYHPELIDVLSEKEYNFMIATVEGIHDAIQASVDEDREEMLTSKNRDRMFRPWINNVRMSKYREYLMRAENYHEFLSENMISLLNALGGRYSYKNTMGIKDTDGNPLIQCDGEKTRIYNGTELVLAGTLGEGDFGRFGIIDGWEKSENYIGEYRNGQYEGQGCEYGLHGETLKDGTWEKGKLIKGMEYNWLIHVEKGRLIYRPKKKKYDATDDFQYCKYEQYDREILPFMNSTSYIEEEGKDGFYVVDMKVKGDREQMVNIRTLENFMGQKKLL